MATKLGIYQEALRLLGDARLATVSDDTPARYALDDAYDAAVLCVLRSAPWRFALKTVEITGTTSATLLPGYSHKFARPTDWSRTHAIFVRESSGYRELPIDVREQDDQFYANVEDIHVRYVSEASAILDESAWPEQFAKAIAVRLAFEVAERITGNPARTGHMLELYERALQQALAFDAVAESQWLRWQLSGMFYQSARWLLDQAFWRFAVKTVELTGTTSDVSPGYTYSVAKPADWGRTMFLYRAVGTDWRTIDFRDEDGKLHFQFEDVVLRYVSTDGEDPTTWSDGFMAALLAYLEYEGAKAVPNAAGAQIQARLLAWKDAYRTAKLKDDLNERPRFNDGSRLVNARRGGTVHGLTREQG